MLIAVGNSSAADNVMVTLESSITVIGDHVHRSTHERKVHRDPETARQFPALDPIFRLSKALLKDKRLARPFLEDGRGQISRLNEDQAQCAQRLGSLADKTA